jgi:hypothetical protein
MLEYINLILICCRSTSHVSLSHYLVMKASFVWVANEQDNVILFLLGKPCLVRKTSNQLHKTKKLSTTLIISLATNTKKTKFCHLISLTAGPLISIFGVILERSRIFGWNLKILLVCSTAPILGVGKNPSTRHSTRHRSVRNSRRSASDKSSGQINVRYHYRFSTQIGLEVRKYNWVGIL